MHPRKGRALTFRDLVACSHQFNAVSRSSLPLAEHPDDKAKRVLARGKGNLAGHVPTLAFRIGSHEFELNGHAFDEPHAVEWEESDLTTDDIMAAKGGGLGAGRPRDEDKWDAVEAALTDQPQGYKKLAQGTGIAVSSLQRILPALAEEGAAHHTEQGWIEGYANKSDPNMRTPLAPPKWLY